MDQPPPWSHASAHGSPVDALSPVHSPIPGSPRSPGTPSGTTPLCPPDLVLLPPSAVLMPLQPFGSTPAPSADHSDMVANASHIILEDEDDQAYEDRQQGSRGRSRHQHQHSQSLESGGSGSLRAHGSTLSPRSSRPNSPSPPPPITTATTLVHPSHHRHHPLGTAISITSSVSSDSTAAPTVESAPAAAGSSSSALQHALSFFSHHGSHHHHDQPAAPSPTLSLPSGSTHTDQYPSSASSSKTLRIELVDHSDVVLQEGQATTMEGTLYVNLHKTTKVKSLNLEFSGRSSVTWVDDNAYSPATRHTTAPHIEHTWPLIPHQHKQPPTIVPAGVHAYPFSLELPNTLPETLTTTHGKVSYRLTATLTKPGLTFHSSTVTLPVTILRRSPPQQARAFQRGGRAVSQPGDKVKYKITLPQIRVPHSTKIPLQVSITTPGPRTTVSVLQVGLWERVVYRADGRKRVDMRLVKIQKSEGWPHEDRHGQPSLEAVTWNKVLLFDMPPMGSELNQCNPSADNGLMKVTHLLRFSILGNDSLKRFRVESEIDIKVLAFEDEYLPEEGYEDESGDPLNGGHDPTNELPSYLTSFTTPRVSFDSERDMDPIMNDDLLRALAARIHLPTYAESEEDASRNPSRDVSRTPSRAQSRSTSPERLLLPLNNTPSPFLSACPPPPPPPPPPPSQQQQQQQQQQQPLQQPIQQLNSYLPNHSHNQYHNHHYHHHSHSHAVSPLVTTSVLAPPGDDDGNDGDISAAASPILASTSLPLPSSTSSIASRSSSNASRVLD